MENINANWFYAAINEILTDLHISEKEISQEVVHALSLSLADKIRDELED